MLEGFGAWTVETVPLPLLAIPPLDLTWLFYFSQDTQEKLESWYTIGKRPRGKDPLGLILNTLFHALLLWRHLFCPLMNVSTQDTLSFVARKLFIII